MRKDYNSTSFNHHPGKGELVVLFAGHSQTVPSHKVYPRVHDYHLLHYVISGKGIFQCSGHTYSLSSGSCFFIFPGELVSYASDPEDPWCYRWVGFKGTQVDSLLTQMGIMPLNPTATTEGNRRIPVLFHQIHTTLHQSQPNVELRSSGLIRLLLAEFTKEAPSDSAIDRQETSAIQQQVEQAVRYLTLQYSESISVDQMAHSLGYHRAHLSKMFKHFTGLSPLNFLLKIRMERAKILLIGPLTIEQIASSVGYPDALYFSKQFHKWSGMSPTTFRKQLQTRARPETSCST